MGACFELANWLIINVGMQLAVEKLFSLPAPEMQHPLLVPSQHLYKEQQHLCPSLHIIDLPFVAAVAAE